jgi:hypothetical protein
MMTDSQKTALAIVGTVLLVGLIILGVFYGMVQIVRQTIHEAVSPITNSNTFLVTRVAEVLHPTPTILPDPVTILHEVRSLARLETIQYTMEKVITAEEGQGALKFLFGDKLIYVAHGRVIAGIDLGKMSPEDMWVQDGVLHVRLPAPEIFIVNIDNDKSYVYNRDTGLLTKGDINLEQTARITAEKEISQSAIDDGILSQAQVNAEDYMSRLLRGLGYPEVVFVRPTPTPSNKP